MLLFIVIDQSYELEIYHFFWVVFDFAKPADR